MTALFTPSRHSSKPSRIKRTPPPPSIKITLKPSRSANRLFIALSTLAVVVLLTSQLPTLLLIGSLLWTAIALITAHRQSYQWQQIHDEGKTWLLVSGTSAERVQRCRQAFRSQHLVILTYVTRSGAQRRVVVWRDAVTSAAFSWLHARISLCQPDVAVKSVATSKPDSFLHPP